MCTLFSFPPSALLFYFAFVVSVTVAALKNITISVPEGTTDHGNLHLLCTPSWWANSISFSLGNYLAHAVTVKFLPGDRAADRITDAVTSLLFLPYGAFRDVSTIMSLAVFAKSDLEMAARAGTLCMVVRTRR